MDQINRIHEKVLDHLIKIRRHNPGFFFVPRKINNKSRLDKGYWFLGNNYYLNLSLWNGGDWKEKIHNIGFVVTVNRNSYVELSAQDSDKKAEFLEEVANELGGFEKQGSKNKWVKHYPGTNYIENLNDFIDNTKPEIDRLIESENPEGIKLLDRGFFNRYTKPIIERREQQIEFGRKNKISKVCWNTKNWKFPSGSEGKSKSIDSYEADHGFGHEEWLFDKSKIIDGYHYAFLQPLNLKTGRHYGKKYNIALITINNLNKQYYLGEIKNVECISKEESIKIYRKYKYNGWLRQMQDDVKRVGADVEYFKRTGADIFFNIRFKFENVHRPDEGMIEIGEEDINVSTNHYVLLPQKSRFDFATVPDTDNGEDDGDEGNKKPTGRRKKVYKGECEYDPYHDKMQNALHDLLKTSAYNYKKVFIEKDHVDIKAITEDNSWHYFELKTDNAKQSIRQALGQILEYAYYPDTEKADKLIIVADEVPNEDVITYLDHIRDLFDLPISYRYFDIEANVLSEDF